MIYDVTRSTVPGIYEGLKHSNLFYYSDIYDAHLRIHDLHLRIHGSHLRIHDLYLHDLHLLILMRWLVTGCLPRILVGMGLLLSVSYIKPIPTHEKSFAAGKSGPNATFDLICLGLGWPWVGLGLGNSSDS